MKKTYERKYGTELNKGITLIALIITIITMLILAGVSISMMLGNNGVLNKATQAKKLYDVSAIKEALEMEKAEIGMESKRVNLDNYLEQITSGEKAYNLNSTDKIDDRNAEIIVNGEHKFLIKDKENGDVEIIYQGIAKIGDLALSSSSGTYTYPTSGTFSVINNSTGGALSVTSESPNIATVSISGNTITVTPGTTAGKAKIVVKSAAVGEYAENRAIYMATVQNGTISISATPYTGTYDGAEHDALTNVTTDPTGTTIEYSTDGVNYSSTMPKIKDTSSFTVSVSASKAGYKTQTETYTVTVNRADGDLTLSATSGTLTYPNDETFTVSGNTGALSVSSNAPDVAIASISGNTVTVTPGTTAGKAIITVTSAETSNYNEKTATYEATVQNGTISISATPYTGTYDGAEHDALTNVTTTPTGTTITYSTDGVNYSSTMPKVQGGGTFTVSVSASKVGYKTQTETYTVTVNRADGGLSLSATSGTYTYPTSGTFTVSGNTGALSVSSNAPNVATASLSGNTVTVTPGTTAGKAIITVTSAETSNYNEKTATYEATVQNGTISISATPYTGTYDGQAHNAVTVTTNPSDAKKEYSTDGTNYSTTMPTVTNVTSYTISVRVSKAGYKTETETYTVTVNKAAGGLNLSATSGTITYPNSTSITASGNTGTISASSSNTNVATVGVSGNTITITPKNVNGTATITVTSAATTNYNAKSVTYSLTVKKGTYSVGESVTVGGKAFYVIGDNGTNVTLLSKTTVGTSTWAYAKTQASKFGSNLGGTGRLMTRAEAEGVAAGYRKIGARYWISDPSNGKFGACIVEVNGNFGGFNGDGGVSIGVRPVVVLSKSML